MRTLRIPFAVVLALAAACAEERAPINRVQPNALDKTFFVGQDFASTADDPEFWAQATLVDVGYGAGQDGLFTSTYAQPMTRVKWIVQEDLLVARLTYERIRDSDGKGAGPASRDGQIVAAYRILSHFDIRRDYNPGTGEETNVTVENSTDRPWYQRRYMRVDWSQNLNTDAYELDMLSQLGIYGGVKYEPLAYYVNDPADRDAPHFDADAGYLDVTTKAFATPQTIDISSFGWGINDIPACWMDYDFMGGGYPSTNCNPVELTIRQAFRRVVDDDYEPADWDGHRFQAYGAFYTDRFGFAREYGMADDKWHRLINRYNIWNQSHFYVNPTARTGAVACYTPQTTPVGADPHRDLNGDGTEDECKEVGRGSRCDTFNQKCTLPYRDRDAITIPWYYTQESTPFYFESTEWATHEWDVAMRSAVMTARYAECQRTHDQNCAANFPVYNGQFDDEQDAIALAREVDDCRNRRAWAGQDCDALADRLATDRNYSKGVVALAKMPEMIVLCHSPVEAGDPSACGSARLPAGMKFSDCHVENPPAACAGALSIRRGDIRYHQVNVIDTPQTPSPWGIMVDAVDPINGKKVSASINVWAQITDYWSRFVVDLARYTKGELSTSDITEGTNVRDWAAASEALSHGGSTGRLSKDQRDARLADALGIELDKLRQARVNGRSLSPALKTKLDNLRVALQDVRADSKVQSTSRIAYQARRERARGSDVEVALTTPAMQQLATLPAGASTQQVLEMASPFRGLSPDQRSDLRRRRENALAERGACVLDEAPSPIGVAALSGVLESKFGKFNPQDSKPVQAARAERMRRWVAQRANYAVLTHEMGHSIALRHNFVSSSDAFSYRPQYWQLRTENGAVTASCSDTADGHVVPDGASCVGPRWLDPVTENETANLEPMFMQSSTMDYAGETTQDMIGIGAYDFAAARMFYGEAVSVFADDSYKANKQRGGGVLAKVDNFGGLLGFRYQLGSGGSAPSIHYSQLQSAFQMIKDCKEVDASKFKPARWNDQEWGNWHSLMDGGIVRVGGKNTRCRQQPVDYVAWDAMGNRDPRYTGGDVQSHVADKAGRTRVPYGFATDRWADLGNLAVYRHDNGADPYEFFDFVIAQQESLSVFDNYRRHRQSFSARSAFERAMGRYMEKLRDGAKSVGLLLNIYRDFALEAGYNFEHLWPVIVDEEFSDVLLGSGIVFDHFARVMQRPQSGGHYLGDDGIVRSDEDSYASHDPVVTIQNGVTKYPTDVSFGGRPLNNSLANNMGEYDSEYTVWAGSYYEKAFTAMLLTESVDNFISSSRNDFLDGRFRNISMADVFPDGFRRWLGTNLTGDELLKGPRLAADADGRPLTGDDGYPARPLGWTSWWPKAGPQACFPDAAVLACSDTPANTVVVDPQIGWEQQKFLIAMTMMFLPENQQETWTAQLGLWETGADTDPGFASRVEYHDPYSGQVFVAKTFGKETIFGRTVQKGPAARMLQYANDLLDAAYETTSGPDLDGDGAPDWVVPALRGDGLPRVKWDPSLKALDARGQEIPGGVEGCNADSNEKCACEANAACVKLRRYSQLPEFVRHVMRAYGMAHPSMRGIY